jgi:hypothetical protein
VAFWLRLHHGVLQALRPRACTGWLGRGMQAYPAPHSRRPSRHPQRTLPPASRPPATPPLSTAPTSRALRLLRSSATRLEDTSRTTPAWRSKRRWSCALWPWACCSQRSAPVTGWGWPPSEQSGPSSGARPCLGPQSCPAPAHRWTPSPALPCKAAHSLRCPQHLTASTRAAAGGSWRQPHSQRATTTSTGRRSPSCSRTTPRAASTAARPTSPSVATMRSPGRTRTARSSCRSSAEWIVSGLLGGFARGLGSRLCCSRRTNCTG